MLVSEQVLGLYKTRLRRQCLLSKKHMLLSLVAVGVHTSDAALTAGIFMLLKDFVMLEIEPKGLPATSPAL